MIFLLGCTFFSRLDWGTPDPGLEWPTMGRGSMKPGMMARSMGHGMMGFSSLSPPEVEQVPTATPGGQATISYIQDIRPIFDRQCVSCHSGSAGLWLESYELALFGSDNGPVIVPGDPDSSNLYLRISGRVQPLMPLGGTPLSPMEISAIQSWIAAGAPNN